MKPIAWIPVMFHAIVNNQTGCLKMSLPRATVICATVLIAAGVALAHAAPPLALHPDNPHYLLFRGKPTVLVTSGEHYGAVLNLDFDYRRYLDELQSKGLNLTRTFSGTYREVAGSFKIEQNTLAPARGRSIAPWARSDQPGAGDGGNKFDLARWDPAYFARLKDFLAEAGKRGIVVELVLFCTIYDDDLWRVNPMNAANVAGEIEQAGRLEAYTLKHPRLTAVQEAFTRKVVAELADFDNLYYEICNEPYFGGVTRQWTQRIAETIEGAEAARPAKHLIAENIANGKALVASPIPQVSIFNFHYASPPDAVAMNYGLNRVIADDETGFKGTGDFWYRREGWEFLLAGGAIYSNLDYSFTCQRPDGTHPVTTSPGGGGDRLRRQLAVLKQFVESLDFVRLRPDAGAVRVNRGTVRALVEAGTAYAVYIHGPSPVELTVELPPGAYRGEWIDTKSGNVAQVVALQHTAGTAKLVSPGFTEDIALRLALAPAK
jgi:hypothetical protein